MRVTIRLPFPHTTLRATFSFLFFQFDSERANVLLNQYFFNLGGTVQYFSAFCISFGTSLYSVVAYLINVAHSLVCLLVSI